LKVEQIAESRRVASNPGFQREAVGCCKRSTPAGVQRIGRGEIYRRCTQLTRRKPRSSGRQGRGIAAHARTRVVGRCGPGSLIELVVKVLGQGLGEQARHENGERECQEK
jgi:hypothetical protein